MLELTSQFDSLLFFTQLSPMLVVFTAAVLVFILASFSEKISSKAAPYISLVGLLAAFVLAWWVWPKVSGQVAATLIFDRLSVAGWMVVVVSSMFAVLSSVSLGGYRAEHYGLLMFSTFGMGIAVAACDLITIVIGLEVTSLSLCALVAFRDDLSGSIEAAMKYFLTGVFATAFFIMGLAFVFGSVGSTDLSLISVRVSEISMAGVRAFFMFGVAMVLIGFAFKVALIPFHAWIPDTYEGASTPVSMFFATGFMAATFVAFMRFGIAAAGSYDERWHHMLWFLSAATMLFGNFAAMRQDSLKRMLGYSSVAHAGLILVLFPSASIDPPGAMGALILYLVTSVFMMGGAFAVLVALSRNASDDVEINRLAGLSRRRPYMAALLSLFLISIAGIPPTLGFFGKYYLLAAAVKNGDVSLVIVAVLASVISVYYCLRPVMVMYFHPCTLSVGGGEATEGDVAFAGGAEAALAPAIMAVILIAAMAITVFGILPQNLVAFVQASIQ